MDERNVNGHFNGKNWQGACGLSRDGVIGVIQNHIWNQRLKFSDSL